MIAISSRIVRFSYSLSLSRARTHTHSLDRTALDEGTARRRDLYLHNTQHSQAPAEFESAIPASEGPQTHALDVDGAATRIGG